MIRSSKKIPYGRHCLDEDDIQAVVEVLENGPITQGQKVEEFGQALAIIQAPNTVWPFPAARQRFTYLLWRWKLAPVTR